MPQSNQQRKSAIKSPPLPYPGKSLQQRVDRLLNEELAFLVFGCVLVLGMALAEWAFWFFEIARMPVVYTSVAVIAWAFAGWRIMRMRAQIRPLRMGIEGEQAVGQFLDDHVRPLGYRLLHDLVQEDGDGSRFNIDHVMIGPGGVYAIETKVRSKPAVGEALRSDPGSV